jgi:choline dehydrogenase-like flavoprotein
LQSFFAEENMLLHEDNGPRAIGQEPRQASWLSCGLETLIDERSRSDRAAGAKGEYDFDVVIVGTGYGGAIAAAALSGCTDESGKSLRICLLERGKEYLPGAFPTRQADLAGYVRFATPNASRQRGAYDGLYDIRWSDDAVVVVASGLGGGSLINAGVMEMPHPAVFQEARWPKAIREAKDLKRLAARLLLLLGANRLPRATALNKTKQLRTLANGHRAALTRITVAGTARSNSAAVKINPCLMCGDCAVGCNHGAKDSLDTNLLVSAARKGARIVTGATVIRVSANDGGSDGWVVHANHTDDHLRDRQPHPFAIRAKRVILAAGTLGSTEILLRSKGPLHFSAQLGRKFSANGDMLVTAYNVTKPVNAVADEAQPVRAPPTADTEAIGPTITGMIDLRNGNPQTDLVIEDLAVPGPLRRLFAEATTTFQVLNQLADPDFKSHEAGWPKEDAAAVDPRAIKHSLVLAMIGRDDAEGELTLGDGPVCDDADGLLTVCWPALRTDPRLQQHHERLAKLMEQSKLGGTVVNNLMWRPFSDALERLFEAHRGPLVTVHPLGGCAMGDDVRQGVTDDCGRVFDANGPTRQSVHEGLVVLDGSIVPTSLGINPSLTISVLALRAIMQLKTQWKLRDNRPCLPLGELERPIYATTDIIRNPALPTQIELTEQVRGHVRLRTPTGTRKPHRVQITLTTAPTALDKLFACEAHGQRSLSIAPGKGTLTILKAGKDFDAVSDQARREDIALEASISGQLRLFEFAQSNWLFRTARALLAWVGNRGLRDFVQDRLQWFQEFLHLRPRPEQVGPMPSGARRIWQFVSGIVSVCSRAGAVRLITYDLIVGSVTFSPGFDASRFKHRSIRAVKRLTYYRAASPFTQLLEMTVERFPEMRPPIIGTFPLLKLNKRYLARQETPLLRVVDQQDGVAALSDMLAFVLYVFRVILQAHALSFRRPDSPLARIPQRLPGIAPGLPGPQIEWLTVDEKAEPPVRIRLTRYDGSARQPAAAVVTRPILLIHGYSASGTTFAHPAVPGNLAQTLCEAGRDVWILDMRCSAGLPTAASDWPFEAMANQDIPVAIEHVSAAHTKGSGQS